MLKIDAIHYLGSCKRGHDNEPVTGLVVASFEWSKLDINEYVKFLVALQDFVDDYNSNSEREKETN